MVPFRAWPAEGLVEACGMDVKLVAPRLQNERNEVQRLSKEMVKKVKKPERKSKVY